MIKLAKAEGIEFKEELSLAEMAAIHSYTLEDDCKEMNEALLSGSDNKEDLAIVEVTKAAMEKLFSHPDTTYRGESAWPGAEAQYKDENEFEIKMFWSTSVSNSFGGVYQITIVPKKDGQGKVVSTFSEFPREVEVLFPPKTKFKVISRTGDASTGHVAVTVKEI